MKTALRNPLLLLFLWTSLTSLACQAILPVNLPTDIPESTETQVPTATFPAPTYTSPPPTPTVELPSYPGFSKVELLSNDIFQTTVELPSATSLIESTIMRPFGGNFGPCIKNPDLPAIQGVFLEYPSVFLCEKTDGNYASGEKKPVEIRLNKPDGSVIEFTQQVVPGERYCLDTYHTLLPGQYSFDISGGEYTHMGEFTIQHAVPQIFIGGGGRYQYFQQMCAPELANGEPVEIFFAGFTPNQSVTVLLYASNEIQDYHYKTSWTAVMDEKGYLAQYIPAVRFPEGAEFVLMVNVSASAPDDMPMMTLSPNPHWTYTAILLSPKP